MEYNVKSTEDVMWSNELVDIKQLKVNVDDRGDLFEIVRTDMLPDGADIKQVYAIENHQVGTIRAYHKHNKLIDYFCIVKGAAIFVFWKTLKTGSSTTTLYQRVVVDERAPVMITVPANIWHGWMSLKQETMLISVASACYDKDNPDEVRTTPDALDRFLPNIWEITKK